MIFLDQFDCIERCGKACSQIYSLNLLFGTDSLCLRSSLTLCTVLTDNSPGVFRFSAGLVTFLPTTVRSLQF